MSKNSISGITYKEENCFSNPDPYFSALLESNPDPGTTILTNTFHTFYPLIPSATFQNCVFTYLTKSSRYQYGSKPTTYLMQIFLPFFSDRKDSLKEKEEMKIFKFSCDAKPGTVLGSAFRQNAGSGSGSPNNKKNSVTIKR
jgi:hypothetical protein